MNQTTMTMAGTGSTAIWQTAFWLLVVVALILIMGWLARRFSALGNPGSHGRMKVMASLALGNRERVVLVKVGKQRLLLGVTPGSVNTLHLFDPDEDLSAAAMTSPPTAASNPFQTILQRALSRAPAPGTHNATKAQHITDNGSRV